MGFAILAATAGCTGKAPLSPSPARRQGAELESPAQTVRPNELCSSAASQPPATSFYWKEAEVIAAFLTRSGQAISAADVAPHLHRPMRAPGLAGVNTLFATPLGHFTLDQRLRVRGYTMAKPPSEWVGRLPIPLDEAERYFVAFLRKQDPEFSAHHTESLRTQGEHGESLSIRWHRTPGAGEHARTGEVEASGYLDSGVVAFSWDAPDELSRTTPPKITKEAATAIMLRSLPPGTVIGEEVPGRRVTARASNVNQALLRPPSLLVEFADRTGDRVRTVWVGEAMPSERSGSGDEMPGISTTLSVDADTGELVRSVPGPLSAESLAEVEREKATMEALETEWERHCK